MKRFQLYFSTIQLEKLTKLAREKDISLSELIRRILDAYLDEEKN